MILSAGTVALRRFSRYLVSVIGGLSVDIGSLVGTDVDYHCRLDYVVRFLFGLCFLPCDYGLDFDTVTIQSINEPM